ncbi:MAG: AbrB/MazE/SpoVT family DNA-binding domain-containing protein [Chloroflexi bacterium]|nr:AbrB/MazE/SpoVT family DNA-binding domain-containing protein [Chloroflexota bacterium]
METIILPKGYVILPLEICRRLGIEAGTRLEVDYDTQTGCIRLRPVNHRYAVDVRVGEKVKQKAREKKQRTTG